MPIAASAASRTASDEAALIVRSTRPCFWPGCIKQRRDAIETTQLPVRRLPYLLEDAAAPIDPARRKTEIARARCVPGALSVGQA
jgi:hypothetical protein